MSFIVESGGDFERCPAGMHLGRCYRIIDTGTQETTYMGIKKFQHKISVAWEIHGADESGNPILMKDGRPFAIFKNYTLSWSDKANLRLDLQSWRGKPFTQEEMRKFDLKNVLGAWCMLNVIERPSQDGSKVYSNVNTISPVPAMIKNAGMPTPVNPLEMFTFQDPDLEMLEKFHDNLKAKIKASPEWKKMMDAKGDDYAQEQNDSANSRQPVNNIDEDIPF